MKKRESGESKGLTTASEAEDGNRESAKAAHLRYVSDRSPGISRSLRKDGSFDYKHPDGTPVDDAPTLERIRKLVLPPAYTDVWITTVPNGHLQATGRDARGRKQYRYHPRWRQIRDADKYDRMLAFGAALPKIRAQVDTDLRRHGLPREKVVAAVVRLLEKTRIRVGNEEYARTNDSYGLTTLHNEHIDVEGNTLHFHFRGKSGKDHKIDLRDPRAAKVVNQCLDLPGQELFQYLDDAGESHCVSSEDVNEYLKASADGDAFTAKDFRTWSGTVLCAMLLADCETATSPTAAKRAINEAIKSVSETLGNTPAICRKCYVNPVVLEAYLDGTMLTDLQIRGGKIGALAASETALSPGEDAVLRFLKERAAEMAIN